MEKKHPYVSPLGNVTRLNLENNVCLQGHSDNTLSKYRFACNRSVVVRERRRRGLNRVGIKKIISKAATESAVDFHTHARGALHNNYARTKNII